MAEHQEPLQAFAQACYDLSFHIHWHSLTLKLKKITASLVNPRILGEFYTNQNFLLSLCIKNKGYRNCVLLGHSDSSVKAFPLCIFLLSSRNQQQPACGSFCNN